MTLENFTTLTLEESTVGEAWESENRFYWLSRADRLGKALSQYELYKSIVHLPGDVFELGVFKAASLIRLATFRNLLEGDYSRSIVGFDAFGRFPREGLLNRSDSIFIDEFEAECGEGLNRELVERILSRKGFENIYLREGNVFETIDRYLMERPATRLAYLHFDLDVMEPTTYALEVLYDRVVPGGLIVFDDYANGLAVGETEAVDRFVKDRKITIQRARFGSVPSFIRKEI